MSKNRLVGILIATVMLFTLQPGQVQSQDQTPINQIIETRAGLQQAMLAPVPGGPGYVMIHASAFMPVSNSLAYSFIGPALATSTGSPSSIYQAPLNLPNGASIIKIVLYCYDNDPAGSILVNLFTYPLPGGAAYSSNSVSSSGSDPNTDRAIELNITTPLKVDLQANAYMLYLTMPAASATKMIYISGLRIDYRYDTALPSVIQK
jgi:hypothetical protein